MIMLRSAYYPAEYLELSESWNKEPVPTKSASKDSAESTAPTHGRKIENSFDEPARLNLPDMRSNPPTIVPQSIKVSQTSSEEFELGHNAAEI